MYPCSLRRDPKKDWTKNKTQKEKKKRKKRKNTRGKYPDEEKQKSKTKIILHQMLDLYRAAQHTILLSFSFNTM